LENQGRRKPEPAGEKLPGKEKGSTWGRKKTIRNAYRVWEGIFEAKKGDVTGMSIQHDQAKKKAITSIRKLGS